MRSWRKGSTRTTATTRRKVDAAKDAATPRMTAVAVKEADAANKDPKENTIHEVATPEDEATPRTAAVALPPEAVMTLPLDEDVGEANGPLPLPAVLTAVPRITHTNWKG